MPVLSFLVEPFADSSDDRNQYVAAEFTNELTKSLSRIPGSLVIARESAIAIADRGLAVTEIGRQFGVRFVLGGGVLRQETHIHVTIAMHDTQTEVPVLNASFDRDFVQFRTLVDEIVTFIAQRLGATVAAPPHPFAELDATSLDALLKANTLVSRPPTVESMAMARQLFATVLRAHPNSPEALVGLANIQLAAALRSSHPTTADILECEQLIERALAVEPRSARTLDILGALQRATNKPREALAAYQAAVAADPNDANARGQIGRIKIDLGQANDAMSDFELALQLSPLDPQRLLWYTFAGLAKLYLGAPSDARAWLERAVEVRPQFLTALVFLAAAQQLGGDDSGARKTIATVRQINPDLSINRVEKQFGPADQNAQAGWSRILESLQQVGLPN
jgi:TolB-like protein/tetratricopeptide (TPR) repeat protein